ncbi:hypothetical protein CcaverHIS002_0202610 [Cutaneotrichosporon cavernicola]|uniref:Carbonic anhydrase n=1 Tax=Cutaneotrichosporon cavernicola TaxID=279322 RepID=A0AA48I0D5_9TREE|nr:uncharacterized protein CcaverHIS019_0202610 [Cutaneotrichosporon cavernicola]BEI81101.1 hypothetical protein CcaverHIS002_0202610 [Cutaneotrichosporon cavernicola]BEI88899.1 hypothetical protein CcaverHIS019_0202610 [Cutaneotrichosporon cavernicola]BEI96676.1 hypothetical protein CcaverHIS631_0202650 [Cutaneotrichosporon cavernicola]BEJ04448.1 hypothetical protein CcaverHIS641_0202650 [Cutaneotrichosporon cavernicola]
MTAPIRIGREVSRVDANEKHNSDVYPELKELLMRNQRWAKHTNARDPSFFPRHYPGQRPEVLWIGCSDARVPETMIMGSQPGDIFVHRGIANLYTPNDDSLNAVLMIALINFKVKHIIVGGHSNCVGCQTALRASLLPPVPETQAIQRYLKPLTQLARLMATEEGPPSLDLLVEENVAQQVTNLLASQVVQDDWKRRGQFGVTVHGWVYQLENGIVRDLGVSQGPPTAKPGGRRMGVRFF